MLFDLNRVFVGKKNLANNALWTNLKFIGRRIGGIWVGTDQSDFLAPFSSSSLTLIVVVRSRDSFVSVASLVCHSLYLFGSRQSPSLGSICINNVRKATVLYILIIGKELVLYFYLNFSVSLFLFFFFLKKDQKNCEQTAMGNNAGFQLVASWFKILTKIDSI